MMLVCMEHVLLQCYRVRNYKYDSMKIIYEKEQLFKYAAEKIGQLISNFLSEKEVVTLGLPGGRSIPPVLNHLSKFSLEWNNVHVFVVDERLVPIDDPESNFGLIKSGLSVAIPKENLHPFLVEYKKEQISLRKYEDEIKRFNGLYDILIVSIGEDGHIGSLFPNHPSIKDKSDFYIIVEDSPKPPSRRMSMSTNMVLRSEACVNLVSGIQKKDALTKLLEGDSNYIDCPAKLTLKIPESFIFTDINLKSNNI